MLCFAGNIQVNDGEFFGRTLLLGLIPNHLIVFRKIGRKFTFKPCSFLRAQLAALLLGISIARLRLQPIEFMFDSIDNFALVFCKSLLLLRLRCRAVGRRRRGYWCRTRHCRRRSRSARGWWRFVVVDIGITESVSALCEDLDC